MNALRGRARQRWLAVLVIIAAALLGCSASGTWSDDPANWERAFSSTKPDSVVVVHSEYWRSPHWTTEFAYYFHIRPDELLESQLFGEGVLIELTGDAADDAFTEFFGETPAWFLPDARERYSVHALSGQPDSNFRVFVDRETGDVFITDNQV